MIKILGIDHICATCKGIDQAKKLECIGYVTSFEERHLSISEEKKPFLKQHGDSHDAVFLTAKKGSSIEIIDHYGSSSQQGRYEVLFESPKILSDVTVKNDPIGKILENVFDCTISKILIPSLNIHYYQKMGSVEGLFTAVLRCNNLDKISKFWITGLGFKEKSFDKKKNSWKLLHFTSPILAWNIDLLLIQDPNMSITSSYLDDLGWTCISIIVSDIDSCLTHLEKLGAKDIGLPYVVKIANNYLKLAFLRGPEAELIELIEFQNK